MNICFRLDSSVQIGTGHLIRSVTLAEQLREQQANVYFATRKDKGQAAQPLRDRGFTVLELPTYTNEKLVENEDAQHFIQLIQETNKLLDWVIVDHYQLSAVWEQKVANEIGVYIGVIDDLANRPHHCDLLLDQNFYSNLQSRYHGLVPPNCKQLLGPAYVILRPEFYQITKLKREHQDKRILIFFGGSDPTGETEKSLQAIQEIALVDWKVDVVVGHANPQRHIIERLCQKIGAKYHCQINYLAELMHKATFSLGAGGVTMWERCFLGLPSLVTIVAENQRQSSMDTASTGAIKLLGWHEQVTVAVYKQAILWAMNHPLELTDISQQGITLMKNEIYPEQEQNLSMSLHPFVVAIVGGN